MTSLVSPPVQRGALVWCGYRKILVSSLVQQVLVGCGYMKRVVSSPVQQGAVVLYEGCVEPSGPVGGAVAMRLHEEGSKREAHRLQEVVQQRPDRTEAQPAAPPAALGAIIGLLVATIAHHQVRLQRPDKGSIHGRVLKQDHGQQEAAAAADVPPQVSQDSPAHAAHAAVLVVVLVPPAGCEDAAVGQQQPPQRQRNQPLGVRHQHIVRLRASSVTAPQHVERHQCHQQAQLAVTARRAPPGGGVRGRGGVGGGRVAADRGGNGGPGRG